MTRYRPVDAKVDLPALELQAHIAQCPEVPTRVAPPEHVQEHPRRASTLPEQIALADAFELRERLR